MNYLEKKINTWIVDFLIAGTSIKTEEMSPEGKSFFEKVKKFFAKGLQQMAKDLDPTKKKNDRIEK